MSELRQSAVGKERARLVVVALAVGWWGLTLFLTLLPLPSQSERSAGTPLTCLVCGETGTVDVLLNFALFAPLGLLVRLAGWSAGASIACGILTSLAVETAQLLVVPGRDPSLSDLLTNTAGTLLGLALARKGGVLLAPAPREASRLIVAGAVLPAAVLAGTAWVLQPAPPLTIWFGQHAPGLGMYEQFPGRVLEAAVGDVRMPVGPLPQSRALAARFRRAGPSLSAVFVAGEATPGLAPIVSVFDDRQKKVILLGQGGRQIYFESRMVAENLRFRPLSFELPAADLLAPGDTVAASGRQLRGAIEMIVSSSRGTDRADYRLSPGLGWVLVAPVALPVTRASRWLGTLWVALLWIPFGHWARAALGDHSSTKSAGRVAALGLGAAAVGLFVGPIAAGLFPAPVLEWTGAVAGSGAGWALFGLTRRWLPRGLPSAEAVAAAG